MANFYKGAISKLKNKVRKDGDLKSIAKGGSTAFIVNLAGILIGYLFVVLISRIYKNSAAQIFGQYVLVTLLVRIGSIITRFGTDTTMLQITASLSADNLWGNILEIDKKLIKILLSIGAVVTILFIVFAKYLGIMLKLPVNMIVISAPFIIPMSLGLYYSQSLRGLKKIGISTFLRSSSLPILNFILLPVFLIFIGKDSPSFNELPSYTFFVSIILTLIIGFFYWKKVSIASHIHRVKYNPDYFKPNSELLRLSYPLLLTESMVFIGTWVDQLLLGIMGNNDDVGIFNVCVKYSLITTLSFQAINTISAPKFAECFFKKDYNDLAKQYQKATKVIFWSSIPIFVAYFLFPKILLGLSGPSFTHGWLAFMIINLGTLFNVMTGSNGTLLQMTGYQSLMQNILLITLVIEIGLNALFIPLYGVTGAAIASTICSFIRNIIMAIYIKRYFKFSSIYLLGFK